MNFRMFFLYVFFFTTVSVVPVFAQQPLPYSGEYTIPDSTDLQIIEMMDGTKLKGKTIAIYDSTIVFTSSLGALTLEKAKIKSFSTIQYRESSRGDLWFRNPNRTRLFFAPTGRMLSEGEGYFSDYYVFFPGIAYGFSNHFTFGGGFSLIPGVGLNKQVFYITPKVGLVQSKKFNAAAGVLVLKIPDEEEGTAGIAYGVGTWGGEDNNFTLGAGYGFANGAWADKPMLVLGFETRTGERTSVVSENWIFPGVDYPLISLGMRFFGEKMSVDLAFWTVLGADTNFIAPYVDFVYNF
ncbi:MAG: hypothetical protein H6696_18985 [Deferribacteres bacterium]|nr:hypothetical protein [candidate division KSB1 bacterium]MCB9504015.1 hypothetical protein [Deferribacteres bacterium]